MNCYDEFSVRNKNSIIEGLHLQYLNHVEVDPSGDHAHPGDEKGEADLEGDGEGRLLLVGGLQERLNDGPVRRRLGDVPGPALVVRRPQELRPRRRRQGRHDDRLLERDPALLRETQRFVGVAGQVLFGLVVPQCCRGKKQLQITLKAACVLGYANNIEQFFLFTQRPDTIRLL